MTRKETVEQMQQRHANGQNVFTGEQLEGKDLKDWKLLNRQREYSLGLVDGESKLYFTRLDIMTLNLSR